MTRLLLLTPDFPPAVGGIQLLLGRLVDRLADDFDIAPNVNVCIDDDLIMRNQRASTAVPAGSTVVITAPMAGG